MAVPTFRIKSSSLTYDFDFSAKYVFFSNIVEICTIVEKCNILKFTPLLKNEYKYVPLLTCALISHYEFASIY